MTEAHKRQAMAQAESWLFENLKKLIKSGHESFKKAWTERDLEAVEKTLSNNNIIISRQMPSFMDMDPTKLYLLGYTISQNGKGVTSRVWHAGEK